GTSCPPIQWLIRLRSVAPRSAGAVTISVISILLAVGPQRSALRCAGMATVDVNPVTGEQIVADAQEYVLYSWSVQNAISPIAVAGAEGRYFWDYEGKRYLDFASQLVNVSLGHQHPKVIAAIKEQ